MYAVLFSNYKIVVLLVENGANIYQKTEYQQTVFNHLENNQNQNLLLEDDIHILNYLNYQKELILS